MREKREKEVVYNELGNLATYVRVSVKWTLLLDMSSVICQTVKKHKDTH